MFRLILKGKDANFKRRCFRSDRGVGATTSNCTFKDIFDSSVTSQLYESTPTQISGHTWTNLRMENYGMHGVEVSCQTSTRQLINDITIENINSKNQGVSWSGDRNGAIITTLTQGGTSRVNRVFATGVVGDVQKRLYLGFQTGGINGIQDCTVTGTYGQGVRSDQGSHALVQYDLKRNVVDNLAPVSASNSWVDVNSDVRGNLRGLHV